AGIVGLAPILVNDFRLAVLRNRHCGPHNLRRLQLLRYLEHYLRLVLLNLTGRGEGARRNPKCERRNPNTEIRNPKEVRSPKFQTAVVMPWASTTSSATRLGF